MGQCIVQSSVVTAKDFQVSNAELPLLSTQRESMWKRNIFWPLEDNKLPAFPSEWLSLFPTVHLTPNVYETLLLPLCALLTSDFVIFSYLSAKARERPCSTASTVTTPPVFQ